MSCFFKSMYHTASQASSRLMKGILLILYVISPLFLFNCQMYMKSDVSCFWESIFKLFMFWLLKLNGQRFHPFVLWFHVGQVGLLSKNYLMMCTFLFPLIPLYKLFTPQTFFQMELKCPSLFFVLCFFVFFLHLV